jgi:hypothetical protein
MACRTREFCECFFWTWFRIRRSQFEIEGCALNHANEKKDEDE